MSAFQNLPSCIVEKIVFNLLTNKENNDSDKAEGTNKIADHIAPLLEVSSSWRNETLKLSCRALRIDEYDRCDFFGHRGISFDELLKMPNKDHLLDLVRDIKIVTSEDTVLCHKSSNKLVQFLKQVKFSMATSLMLVIELDSYLARIYESDLSSDHGYGSDFNNGYKDGENAESYNRDIDIRFARNRRHEKEMLKFIQYLKRMMPSVQRVSLTLGSRYMRCYSKFDGMAEGLYSIFQGMSDCSLSMYHSNYPRCSSEPVEFKLRMLDINCYDDNPRTSELIRRHADTLENLKILFTGAEGYVLQAVLGLDKQLVYPNLHTLYLGPYIGDNRPENPIETGPDYVPFPKLRRLTVRNPYPYLHDEITRENQVDVIWD